MKITALAVILLTLAGCAQAHVYEWKDKEITLCSDHTCKGDCFKKRITQACDGPFEQISSFSSGNTADWSSRQDIYGNRYIGETNCKKYRCDGKLQLE